LIGYKFEKFYEEVKANREADALSQVGLTAINVLTVRSHQKLDIRVIQRELVVDPQLGKIRKQVEAGSDQWPNIEIKIFQKKSMA